MTRVHVLADPDLAFNAFAFLYPVWRYRDAIERAGFDVRVVRSPRDELADCDVLILEGQHVTLSEAWRRDPEGVLDRIDRWRDRAGRLLWFDTTASTFTPHVRVLPHVDGFFKGQLLADRDLYGEPFYGGRIYTDHYHRRHGIEDGTEQRATPVPADQRDKMEVFWSSALADFSWSRPLVRRLHRWTGWHGLLGAPRRWTPPSVDRGTDVSARFGASKERATVGFQRARMLELLPDDLDTSRVSRWRYFRELRDAKVTPSPFGWGEKCYRDYEAILSGSLLLKPDMDHMETWPDLYRDDAMVPVSWDLDELPKVLDQVLSDYGSYLPRARRAQEIYRDHLVGPKARERFVERFETVVAG